MNFFTTRAITIACGLLTTLSASAQVTNGNFSDAQKAPRNFSQIHWAKGWSNGNGGTADFYHKNASECSSMGIPSNKVGNQDAFNGEGYAGIITYCNDKTVDMASSLRNGEVMEGSGYGKYSEYLTTHLSAPLTAGASYTFTFYASLAENSGYATSGLGAYFSSSAMAEKSNAFITATPQVKSSSTIDSKSNWTKITGTFVAKGGEQFVTIGLFNGAENPKAVAGGSGINGKRAYYFIDGISLVNGGMIEKDSDGDGIADKDDACPTVYGTVKGCPDTDGDGFADMNDDCPEVPGKLKGCPENDTKDSDGDGIVDSKDKCPTVFGTIKGCPDTDGDGIADIEDQCPTVKGTLQGCPDTDGDGVADKDDECPEVAGKKALNGCPLSKAELAEIKSASEHIYFNSGKSTIKEESFSDLDKLAKILKEHPEVKASVEGHTDSQGNDKLNMDLSVARAKAVKDYLISKGVEADHLGSEGFGETKPIATNETADGRAKNRRVIVQTSMYKVD